MPCRGEYLRFLGNLRRWPLAILAAYDIVDDSRRSKVAGILLDYGNRVQESVYWLEIDDELMERMMRRIHTALDEANDVLWLVPVCSRCSGSIKILGTGKKPEIPEFWVL